MKFYQLNMIPNHYDLKHHRLFMDEERNRFSDLNGKVKECGDGRDFLVGSYIL